MCEDKISTRLQKIMSEIAKWTNILLLKIMFEPTAGSLSVTIEIHIEQRKIPILTWKALQALLFS